MDQTINLKKTDGGIVVVTHSQTETPLDADEIKRQIRQHADVITTLEAQLKVLETFQASAKTEDSPVVVQQAESIIDNVKLDATTFIEEVVEMETK